MSDGNSKARSLLGFIIGGAIGTVIGLLVAPERGEKLRRRLAYQIDHAAARVGDTILHYGQFRSESEARKSASEMKADLELRAEQISKEMDAVMVSARHHKSSTPKQSAEANG